MCLLVSLILIGSLCMGCSSSEKGFWEAENQLRILGPYCSNEQHSEGDNVFNSERKIVGVVSEEDLQELQQIMNGMKKFFAEEYDVDISTKIDELPTIRTFTMEAKDGIILDGYYEPSLNQLALRKEVLNDKVARNAVFVHEMLHYLGFSQQNCGIFLEGLTDALSVKCQEYLGLEVYQSNAYDLSRKLGFQILEVDKELVKKAFTEPDFDIYSRINERLANVKQPITQIDAKDIAPNLDWCVSCIFFSPYQDTTSLQFQAQEIVACYLKTFEPTEAQIEVIRQNYIVADYEEIK